MCVFLCLITVVPRACVCDDTVSQRGEESRGQRSEYQEEGKEKKERKDVKERGNIREREKKGRDERESPMEWIT